MPVEEEAAGDSNDDGEGGGGAEEEEGGDGGDGEDDDGRDGEKKTCSQARSIHEVCVCVVMINNMLKTLPYLGQHHHNVLLSCLPRWCLMCGD